MTTALAEWNKAASNARNLAMNFCPQCATPLEWADFGGRMRAGCPRPRCGFVHWDNPVPVVGGIVEWENQIVLVRNDDYWGDKAKLEV